MSAYNFNPDVCLQVLHGIAEEIPSGFSRSDLKAICPKITFAQELHSFVRNSIVKLIKKTIDRVWEIYQIPEKLKHLEQLEKKQTQKPAWRPTTGKADVKPIIAHSLTERKIKLMKEIEAVKKETEMIVPYLQKFSEQSKQQLEEIERIEKSVFYVGSSNLK